MKEKEFFTIKQVAELLNLDPRTVHLYITEGKIKSIKVGGTKKVGRRLIPKEELDRFLKECGAND